jgi:hypothetical protein
MWIRNPDNSHSRRFFCLSTCFLFAALGIFYTFISFVLVLVAYPSSSPISCIRLEDVSFFNSLSKILPVKCKLRGPCAISVIKQAMA